MHDTVTLRHCTTRCLTLPSLFLFVILYVTFNPFFLIFLPINTLLWLKHISAKHFAEHCAFIIKIRNNVEAKFCNFFELNEILFYPYIVYDKFTYTAYIFLTVFQGPLSKWTSCPFSVHRLAKFCTLCAWNVQ